MLEKPETCCGGAAWEVLQDAGACKMVCFNTRGGVWGGRATDREISSIHVLFFLLELKTSRLPKRPHRVNIWEVLQDAGACKMVCLNTRGGGGGSGEGGQAIGRSHQFMNYSSC